MKTRKHIRKHKHRTTRKHNRKLSRKYTMRGGSVLNAPNGSVVIDRDKGDKYSPFIAIDKEEAEREDF